MLARGCQYHDITTLFSVTLSNTAALYVSGISTLDMLGLNVSVYKNILGTCCSDDDQYGTANLIDRHQHRRATMAVAVMKVAAKRLTNVQVEIEVHHYCHWSSIEVKRMSAVLTLALALFPITTALMSSFGTTEMSRQLTPTLSIVTESTSGRRQSSTKNR